jgi:MFS family permease
VPGIVVGWCLAQAGLNTMQAGIVAYVPDRVPVRQRGAVSGWMGIAQTVAVIAAVVLVARLIPGNAGYVALAVAVILFALPFVVRTPDEPLASAERLGLSWRSFWVSPRLHRDFGWAWLTRFLMVLGNAMAVVFLLYFLSDRPGFSRLFPGQRAADGLVLVLAVYTVTVIATTVVGGAISDRSGRRRRSVAISGIVMAVPAVLLAVWPVVSVLFVSAAILGAGFGVYLSVDQALVTQVLPSAGTRANDLGVISIASSSGQAVAPALAAPLVTYLRRPR